MTKVTELSGCLHALAAMRRGGFWGFARGVHNMTKATAVHVRGVDGLTVLHEGFTT